MKRMHFEGLRAEANRLRSAEPSKAIRGFDETQTRALLDAAATQLDAAASELEALRQELERLQSEKGGEVATEEAIGKALLAATRAGEEIAADARISAERITSEAEKRAAGILEEATAAAEEREQEIVAARAAFEQESAAARLELERERTRVLRQAKKEAAKIIAEAREEVQQLEGYADQLRSLVVESQRRFVELAESALLQLDGVGAEGDSRSRDLLDELRPVGGEPSASALTGE